jgi:hypothetical protein
MYIASMALVGFPWFKQNIWVGVSLALVVVWVRGPMDIYRLSLGLLIFVRVLVDSDSL